ncbi:MAG: hypothetical protein GY761_13505 [Hyphomicrobiales bacterium]|nr:hypothetical protein [Hyphomicrobiales bacterium]
MSEQDAYGERSGPSVLLLGGDQSGGDAPNYKKQYLAKKYALYDWNFVPLVSQDLDLLCSIDILMLRPQNPGNILKSGDLDGRLKTLFDALSIPDANQGYIERNAPNHQKPMFVLLEDDRLITKASVETDQLLKTTPVFTMKTKCI